MAYFPRKTGLNCYSKQKAKFNYNCFCCNDTIEKKSNRFVNSLQMNLCLLCYDEWNKNGGALGEISRSNLNY